MRGRAVTCVEFRENNESNLQFSYGFIKFYSFNNGKCPCKSVNFVFVVECLQMWVRIAVFEHNYDGVQSKWKQWVLIEMNTTSTPQLGEGEGQSLANQLINLFSLYRKNRYLQKARMRNAMNKYGLWLRSYQCHFDANGPN